MAGEAQADNGGRRGMATGRYTLVIGDKNISSWSLRPWLALKQCRIPFTEERVRLRQPRVLMSEPSRSGVSLKGRRTC